MVCPNINVICIDDEELLNAYIHDASPLEGEVPEGILFPSNTEEVSKVLKWAYEYEVPIYPYGGGSSLVGSPLPFGGYVIDTSLLLEYELYPKDNLVLAGAGWVLSELNSKLSEEGLWFPVDPGSVDMASVGGIVSTNAGGIRAVKYGVTADNVRAVEFVTGKGDIVWSGAWSKKSSTWIRLHQLIVGSEGNFGVITKALLKVVPRPKKRTALMVQSDNEEEMGELILKLLKLEPSALEMMDPKTIEAVNAHPSSPLRLSPKFTLLVEFDDDKQEEKAHIVEREYDGMYGGEELWKYRKLAGPSLTMVKGSRSDWDVAFPVSLIPKAIKYIYENRGDWDIAIFGHVGDGNLHVNLLHPPGSEWVKRATEKAKEMICDMSKKLKATVSGEHGIGLLKLALLDCEVGKDAIEYWKIIKSVFDPKYILNPGKKIPL